jgi:hypothetical protein
MLSNHPHITDLLYETAVERLANKRNISLEEATTAMSSLSFTEYVKLLEAGTSIPSPSGQVIGPNGAAAMNANPQQAPAQNTQQPAQNAPAKAQVMYTGKGGPIEQGMTVGLKGPNGMPVAGEITQVDAGRKGVAVKNPTTGQEEWHGNDELEPFVGGSTTPGATNQAAGLQQQQMAEDIARMKHLAGIAEDCSGGATGAGAIAIAPVSMGETKRRKKTTENAMDEYTPTVAKTVVGDTKPNQDSGKLSARLAKSGKPTATRNNNGFKK